MPKAVDVKVGFIVNYDGKVAFVRNVEVRSPSARGAATLYKLTMNVLSTGQKLEATLKGDDILGEVDYQRCQLQALFGDGSEWTYMNVENYDQYQLSMDDLGDQAKWMSDGLEGLQGMLVDDKLVSISLPSKLVRKVVDTAPSLKGATATKSAKPALIEGGISIMVPDYISVDELIEVSPEEERYMGRA